MVGWYLVLICGLGLVFGTGLSFVFWVLNCVFWCSVLSGVLVIRSARSFGVWWIAGFCGFVLGLVVW